MTMSPETQLKIRKEGSCLGKETSEPAWSKSVLIGTGSLNATTFQGMLTKKPFAGSAGAPGTRCLGEGREWLV